MKRSVLCILLIISFVCLVSCSKGQEKAEIDLTAMSTSIAYSLLTHMVSNSEDYIGKTVRIAGQFATMADPYTGKRYYACRIQDATACCGQSLEFELQGKHVYPDDYPVQGKRVEVVGVFDTYEEEGFDYCTLRNAELVK